MSEQNVLNPTQTSLLNPDWGYMEGLPEMRSLFQPMSGKMFSRRQFARGRTYELPWNNRDLATKHALQQWERQYENDFFVLADWERGRYFSGRFDGPLTYTPVGNQQYNIKGRFIELPGLAMFQYPTNWSRDAIFLEERNAFGEDLVKLTGSGWLFQSGDPTNWHGAAGGHYTSNVTGDYAEWLYFGYGFRFWSAKASSFGIENIVVTRVRDGQVMAGPGSMDLYSAATVPSGPQLTCAVAGSDSAIISFALDLYRVKVTVSGTKNASSSGFSCFADAIEVMQ